MRYKYMIVLFFLKFNFVFAAESSSNSYQKEFIFLKTQLTALKSRRLKTSTQLKDMKFKLQKEVFALGSKISKLNTENEKLKSKLTKFDENRSDKEMVLKKIEVISSQMNEFVNKYTKTSSLSVQESNDFILRFLKNGSRVFSTQGFIYNQKGIREKSNLINVGHIASYAKSPEGLTPLSAGLLRTDLFLTDEKKVSSFKKGELSSKLIILKEGGVREKPATLSSILKTKLKAGGFVGYVIILLGLVGVFIAILRFLLIRPYSSFDEDGIRSIIGHIQMNEVEKAKDILETQSRNPLTYFLDKLISYRHKPNEIYESLVLDEISKTQSKVSKYGPYLIVLAAVAPLLGLLGTVTGMISTFDMITTHGTGNPKLLSGGIKEALVTTQMGLVVAIPCILVGNYLSSQALKVVSKFEEVASTLPKV